MQHVNYLEKILQSKRLEVERLLLEVSSDVQHPVHKVMNHTQAASSHFSTALRTPHLAVIGEVKRRSPSRGGLCAIEDPAKLALKYCKGGASAISVLTDKEYFGGSLTDLREVVELVKEHFPQVAIMRKEFIIHPIQLAETVAVGAHAVLLIAKAVKRELKSLIREARRLGLETLTEVHDQEDLELALEAEAPIIGVNQRNLNTFEMHKESSETLRSMIPSNVISVAESGIQDYQDAKRMRNLGYDAILVGEALVKAPDPEYFMRRLRGAGNEG